MLRFLVLAMLFASAAPVYAQDASATALTAAGCGPDNVKFEAKKDKNAHPLPTPDAGKAVVYLIGDTVSDTAKGIGMPVTRIGIDGKWVAASAMGSYITLQVDPGDHRLCISYQLVIKKTQSKLSAATSFTAVAAQTYYFRTVSPPAPPPNEPIDIVPMDPAEALVMIAKTGYSTFTQKK
jgi:hypothetical protein